MQNYAKSIETQEPPPTFGMQYPFFITLKPQGPEFWETEDWQNLPALCLNFDLRSPHSRNKGNLKVTNGCNISKSDFIFWNTLCSVEYCE